MDEMLYNLMNWPEIEAITYSEHDNPRHILGPHVTSEGILINVFMPTAGSIRAIIPSKKGSEDRIYPMELADEAGFFSVLIPGKTIMKYKLSVTYDNGVEVELYDPYSFPQQFNEQDCFRFNKGIHYDIYDKLGAHICEINGVKGVLFAVWAPNALRVSVVGDFNLWDGRRHPMNRIADAGVFELFIPGLKEGEIYKYELKLKGGMVILKADPYANFAEVRPNTASKIWDLNKYEWGDREYLKTRKKRDFYREPVNIYEVHLGTFRKPNPSIDEQGNEILYTYRELAPILAEYVQDMGYTHIEIMPIMEYPFDGSWGYQVTGYYAPTARYNTPDDFMYFVDYMHSKNIGIILDWVPAHFPRDAHGLATFDGTCLYEHQDPRKGAHPHWGTLIYNYGRPQVSNFLIANALFWLEKYHADGIRVDAVASMLYLDYGKKDGEWIPNIYGKNENLEAIELLKHLNSIIEKRKDGSFIIAEESTAWPKVSHPVEKEGLGFQFKWNMGWMNDILDYMKCDPFFRRGRQGELTFSMIYAYSEHFILVLSHDEVVHGKCSLINKMPGEENQKFANLRAMYGFMYTHPGKKLLFMGQEFGMDLEWNEYTEIQWDLLEKPKNQMLKQFVKDLNHCYLTQKALYEYDYETEGFEWIDTLDSQRSIIIYLRKALHPEDTLLVICNFTPNLYEDYKVGVPFQGKYKEILNSDHIEYGGEGNINPRMKQSKKDPMHERDQSILVTVPPMGISIFSCIPIEPKKAEKATNAAAKKARQTKAEKTKTIPEDSGKKTGQKNGKKPAGTRKTKQSSVNKVGADEPTMQKLEQPITNGQADKEKQTIEAEQVILREKDMEAEQVIVPEKDMEAEQMILPEKDEEADEMFTQDKSIEENQVADLGQSDKVEQNVKLDQSVEAKEWVASTSEEQKSEGFTSKEKQTITNKQKEESIESNIQKLD